MCKPHVHTWHVISELGRDKNRVRTCYYVAFYVRRSVRSGIEAPRAVEILSRLFSLPRARCTVETFSCVPFLRFLALPPYVSPNATLLRPLTPHVDTRCSSYGGLYLVTKDIMQRYGFMMWRKMGVAGYVVVCEASSVVLNMDERNVWPCQEWGAPVDSEG